MKTEPDARVAAVEAMLGVLNAEGVVLRLIITALEDRGALPRGLVVEQLGLLGAKMRSTADLKDPKVNAELTCLSYLYGVLSQREPGGSLQA